jgi:hypothetical protein
MARAAGQLLGYLHATLNESSLPPLFLQEHIAILRC